MAPPAVQPKKPRLEEAGVEEDTVVLQPSQLDKFRPDRGGEAAPSPGAVGANRIAARVSGAACEAYFADGARVYRVSVPLQPQVQAEAGKEGVLIPTPAQAAPATLVHGGSSADGEIQALALLSSPDLQAPDWLGSVDCYGCVNIQRLPPRCRGPQQQQQQQQEQEGAAAACCSLRLEPPPGLGNREAGWAGLALGRPPGGAGGGGELLVATALRFGKVAAVYQGDQLLRSFHTQGHPTALTWLPSLAGSPGDVVAVAEESSVTLWDVRQGERGGLMQQLSLAPPGDTIFSVAWVPTGSQGLLASAGQERAVVVTEPRKWKMVHKWSAAVKYTIHYMAFSHVNPRYCYVSGLDYECVCGRWDRSASSSAGNANSASGAGHGRAVGPKGVPGIAGRHGQRSMALGEEAAAAGAGAGGAEGAEGTEPSGPGAAVGSAEVPVEEAEAEAKVHPSSRRPDALGITFRSDSRWLGMACADGSSWLGRPCDVVATYSQSGHVYLLQTRGRVEEPLAAAEGAGG